MFLESEIGIRFIAVIYLSSLFHTVLLLYGGMAITAHCVGSRPTFVSWKSVIKRFCKTAFVYERLILFFICSTM